MLTQFTTDDIEDGDLLVAHYILNDEGVARLDAVELIKSGEQAETVNITRVGR